ncbi:MAG: hypothetical protein ABI273_17845 [Lacunisphaera sp.]
MVRRHPKTVAAQVAPTIKAMVASCSQNGAVVGVEQSAALNRVRADADRAAAQGRAIVARREASNSAFNSHMDDLDCSGKVFHDYQLDRSVVRDNDCS